MSKFAKMPIKKGHTIAFFSPSWSVNKSIIEDGAKYLETLGFKVYIPEQVYLKSGQVSGTVIERCEALYELLENQNISAIMCVGGGYGSLQLLEHLDYKRIKKNIKPIVGYSDVTALLNAIHSKTGMATYHGPMVNTFACKPSNQTNKSLINTFIEGIKCWDFSDYKNSALLQKGKGEGVLLGGNMTLFDQLIGTSYMPKYEDIILLLEETANEKINELDKKLLHLKHAGILNNVRGIILAGMEDLSDNKMPFGFSVKEIIQQYLPDNIPVVSNTPCGHGDIILTMPIGAEVVLDNMKLELL